MTDSGEGSSSERQPFMERLMFHGIPAWTLFLTVALGALLTLGFGALVASANGGGKGGISGLAHSIATMPSTLVRAVRGSVPFRSPRVKQEKLPGGFFRPAGSPTDPGYLLMTRYDPAKGEAGVEILRLSDGKVAKKYDIDINDLVSRATFPTPLTDPITRANYGPSHPMLMDDGGLMFKNPMSSLVRLDACGKVSWVLKGVYHHSLERGPDGDYWTPMSLEKPGIANVRPSFRDDAIGRVSPDGKLKQTIMIRDILASNGLAHLWEGYPYRDDPFHLNDVQPAMSSGPYWEKGDLFLSIRDIRTVLLYRPSTGKVLWHERAPWTMQHDVTILDDHRVSVFNNNVVPGTGGVSGAHFRTPDDTNELVVYDFATNTASRPFQAAEERLGPKTFSEGRGLVLGNGDALIEETNFGRVMRVTPDGTLRWRYVSQDDAGQRYRLAWSRYIPGDAAAPVQAAVNAKCN